jgi:hypothetical protein
MAVGFNATTVRGTWQIPLERRRRTCHYYSATAIPIGGSPADSARRQLRLENR